MRSFRLVAVLSLVIVCLAEQPAGGAIEAGRLGIGDSVMLGAREELHARGFRIVDAVESRQFYSAASRVRYWKGAGKLPKNVVIHLGNNGIVLRSDCSHAVQAAGRRRVFLVTLKVPRSWRVVDNRRLRRCARRFGNGVRGSDQPPHRRGRLRSRGVASIHSTRWPARADEGARLESV